MKYRNEWKYVVQEAQLKMIEPRLEAVLERDKHAGSNGSYEIHSLYFDDYKNSCVADNDAGLSRRYKWRIRYYGDNIDHLTLERKEKYQGRCRKKSCRLSLEDYQNIIDGNIDELLFKKDADPLLKYFCKDILIRMFKPKVIVNYVREAFVDETTNVRITFDRYISASFETDRFLSGDYLSIPLLNTDHHVLEVKFDDILPSYIKQAVFLNSLNQSSFSKYYLSVLKLGRN